MAAELSTLVSSFLDTNPETYAAFFLECVNSKQHLNTEKIPDGWIGRVNSFLNSKTESWLGMCLLGITVDQCDTDTFTKNCASWLRTILQIIQVPDKSNIVQYCSKLIDDILRYAVEFPELSRELANSVIPAIVSAVLSNKCADVSAVLSILSSCIRHFPGPSGPFRNQIEKFLLPLLNSSCEETRKGSCYCYALLPRCSRSGGSGKKQVCPWKTQWNKVLCTIHKLLDAAYENVEPVPSRSSQESSCESEILPLGEISQIEPGRTYTLVTRCNTMIHCLSVMIREEYLKVVTIPIDATFSLLHRIVSVTSNSLKNTVVVESVLLRACLPLIHSSAVDLLTNLITRCGTLMLPYCDLLMRVLIQELTWTKYQDPTHGHPKPYRKLRCCVYLCIEHWIQLTNSLPEEGGVVAKLMQHVLDDIRPLVSQTKLLPSTHTGSQQMSKKAKKRKLLEDVDQLLTGQQKLDVKANEMITYRALKALSAVLIGSGGDIPQDALREVQVCIIRLIIQCQQSPYVSSPIPFTSAACRQALYHVLQCCLLTNSPYVPSPVNHAVRLFSGGLQDVDLKVSSFCQEALAVANAIIHPRTFPQVCSASGPLSLVTSENPSTNGLVDRHQSTSELYSSSSLIQMASENSLPQQSILSRGAFENGNGIGYSQTEKTNMRYTETCQAAKGNDAVEASSTNFGNKSGEGSEIGTSQEQIEKSIASGSDSTVGQAEISCNELEHSLATNTDSQSEMQLTASSSNMSTAQVLNQEGFFAANTSKTLLEDFNHGTEIRDGTGSSRQPGEVHDAHERLGSSEPKRRKINDDSSVSNGGPLKESHSVDTPSKEQRVESTAEKEAETIEDDDGDETAEMLASFVDSYPDSDEQEIA